MAGFQEALKMMRAGAQWDIYMPARLCTNKKGELGGGRALYGYLQLLDVK
jgi:hypothetical protein